MPRLHAESRERVTQHSRQGTVSVGCGASPATHFMKRPRAQRRYFGVVATKMSLADPRSIGRVDEEK